MRFRYDSPFFEFMNTLAAFIGLNVVFLITCLPIVTIGPALTALYTVTMQEARKEHGYIFSTYFKVFKASFKPSFLGGLFYLIIGAVLLFNAAFWSALGTILGNIILLLITFALVASVISFLYTFPLLARFDGNRYSKAPFRSQWHTENTPWRFLAFRQLSLFSACSSHSRKSLWYFLDFRFLLTATLSCSSGSSGIMRNRRQNQRKFLRLPVSTR